MMTLLNTVSQNITDEALIDDLVFVKNLVQQENFHVSLQNQFLKLNLSS